MLMMLLIVILIFQCQIINQDKMILLILKIFTKIVTTVEINIKNLQRINNDVIEL